MDKPRILVFDIETAPILAWVWDRRDQNISLAQIKQDWFVLAFSAKWLDEPASKIIYRDQRSAKNITDDKEILKTVWELLDEADFVVTQNGKEFDSKKLNARFILNKMGRPSPYKHLDTLKIIRKVAKMTSSSLEYLTENLNVKYKKLSHKRFPGWSLWTECLDGNKQAWEEMKKYNIHDVLSTEELYLNIQAWDDSVNFSIGKNVDHPTCICGSSSLQPRGFQYTAAGKFQRYRCACERWTRGRTNLLLKGEQ